MSAYRGVQHGAALLAASAYVASVAPTLLGGTISTLVMAALRTGQISAAFATWIVCTAAGAALFVGGLGPARSRYNAPDGWAIARAAGLLIGCAYLLQMIGTSFAAGTWGGWMAVASPGLVWAGLAYGATGFLLPLRGVFAALRRGLVPNRKTTPEARRAAELAKELREFREVTAGLLADIEKWRAAVNERDKAITILTTERDSFTAVAAETKAALAAKEETCARFALLGKKYKAQFLELESILQIPAVLDAARRAALADAHPDRAHSAAEQAARTARFQATNAVFDRLAKNRAAA